ncbi:hypothetical protein [Actinophytocola sp.]|uniref:hypothetical protein n=1 Tax=Actinophytocola sp. TaxID=1872138 RepID=UPI002D7F7D5C|nr:hypothetical protein [Actinophytocola sp.]HET9143607.1 hypothetical protein [Actinophytocola sp.]
MRRVFWLGVGIATGVALTRKAQSAVRQASPSGIAANLGEAMRELATAVGAFGADIRAGMAEREEELSEMVEQRSGVSPLARRALGASAPATRRPAHASDARARRANG